MITKDSINSAYCFLHQKFRVYEYSTDEMQKDDIEFAISTYVDGMNEALYNELSKGRTEFLQSHQTFAADMQEAISFLEQQL
ncbi:hypothetical protein [Prevotella ihumii]|uniref:hypothetical protein n=1 Tax=Prevotella ihumii TaxID=1917878 RepID=UPI000980ACCA|nr:hypothetical protein [Prevotella ihumii]